MWPTRTRPPRWRRRSVVLAGIAVAIAFAGSARADTATPTPTPTTTATPPLSHFQCYEAHGDRNEMPVTLQDRFGPSTGTLIDPHRLCAPADKNDESPAAPLAPEHLTGYRLKQLTPKPAKVFGERFVNQFGTLVVTVLRPDYLLVPSAKDLGDFPSPLATPTIDHFKCYKVRSARFRRPGVKVTDQFGTLNFDLKKPVRMCAPVDKNGEGIRDPLTHLVCYKERLARGTVFTPAGEVFINNQFGDDDFEIFRPTELCVPTDPCVSEVSEVSWVGVDPGDGLTNYQAGVNPANRGGGDRIFAERNHPVGDANDQLHDKIKVRVKVAPPPPVGKTATVYLKIFDPDHYSANAIVDPNGVTDPNDNIRIGGTIDLGASLSAPSAALVGNGIADTVEVVMTITARQPTNNFKVVASCSPLFLNSVMFAADGVTLKQRTPTGPDVPANAQTPLLTVWRSVYLELDHMGTVDPDEGPFDQESKRDTGNITAGAGTATITSDITIFQGGQFQSGEIKLLDNVNASVGTRTVTTNTAGANSVLTLTAASPATTAQIDRLIDDDLAPVTAAPLTSPAFPDTTSFNDPAYFGSACVFADTTTLAAQQTNNVVFDLNMGAQANTAGEFAALRASMAAGKQVTSTDDFWAVDLQGAYQGSTNDSTDPDDGVGNFPTLGIATSGTGTLPAIAANAGEGGVLIYYESLRDTASEAGVNLTTMIRQTTLHECGHEFGMLHGDAGIMKSAGTPTPEIIEPASELFQPVSLRRIMRINHPGFGGS